MGAKTPAPGRRPTATAGRLLALGLALGFSLLGSAGRLAAADAVSAPAKNWVLPLFTPTGYRSMTLRGAEVYPAGEDRIDIVNMAIDVFSGDAATRIDSILLSPAASFYPHRNRASGDGSVRLLLLREGIEVTGERWSYDADQKKVFIGKNVRVVFHAALNGILQ